MHDLVSPACRSDCSCRSEWLGAHLASAPRGGVFPLLTGAIASGFGEPFLMCKANFIGNDWQTYALENARLICHNAQRKILARSTNKLSPNTCCDATLQLACECWPLICQLCGSNSCMARDLCPMDIQWRCQIGLQS